MGFFYGFLCGLLFIPFSILAGLYYFFNYSESYAEQRQEKLEKEALLEREQDLDLDDMPSSLYASYISQQRHGFGGGGFPGSGNGLPGSGLLLPEHLDPQYQFAGWISVKRIPEVDHRIIEPSVKKENKKHATKNGASGQSNGNRKGSQTIGGGPIDEPGRGAGVAGSMGAGAAQDPRFTYLDTQNPHLSLPPCLQARFKDSKYGVVKGATMFIYENELMQECLGVITLPNYQISVPGQQKDSHIFSKRHPIWLKYSPSSTHSRRQTAESDLSLSAKDYYLSMVSCVDKEDLYFTLLRCAKLKTHSRSFLREIPKRDSTLFDKSAMNTLIRTIHSNEHQFQAAWLNAILGRMFLGVYKTPQIKDMVFQKMVEKLSRVRLPNFLNDMRMKSVHLGDGVPLITRPKLLTLKPNGDMIMDLSLLYQGGFRAEVEAEAVVTVTKKIQPIKVSLVLVMTLIRLEGRVQVWVKPPPCNRIWYGFYHKPHVEMKIEPVVSDKHITSNLIIKAIENKMLEAIAETMVLPNMDDIPFSDSDGIGGIFGEEISPGGATEIPTTSASSTKSGPKSLPKRSHSPGPRSATINLADGAHNHPRTAIEIPHDLRHRADTMYMTAPAMYQNPNGARSHASLGDELMQTNYTYDSQNRRLNLEEDPMRVTATAGAGQEELITGHMSTSPEAIPSTKTLRVPGGCGIVVDNDIGSPSQGYDSSASNNTNNSNTTSTNRLLQRKAAASNNHGRRGSLDPGMNLSYTTGASNPSSTANSFQPQGTENVRTMEEHWSHYGIHEYEPAPPEGGKGLTSKERKKLKVSKNSGDKSGNNMVDGDRASVHSKDSGDTNSTHTGTTRWTENSGQSLLGNSSQSTLDASGASSLYSPSAKSDKFSLSKMFQGFRKKHTKGVHSGSSFQLQNSSTDGLGRYPGEGDSGSILLEEDEDVHLGEEMSYNDHLHPLSGGGSRIPGGQGEQGDLLNAYSPQFRQKFESTPNLSTALYSTEPDLVAPIQQDGSGLLGYEEYELMHERREGSPVSSVYASSLFGDDSPVDQNHKNGSNKSPTNSNSNSNSNNNNNSNHHHLLLNFSPKFGTALRKLRNRSHGGSGSSKEELHIPTGDLHEVLRRHQQQQQQLQQQQIEPGRLSASENTSQYALYNGGHESSSPSQTVPNSSTSTSSGASRGVGGETQEDEQFPNGMVPGTFISTAAYNGGAPSSGGRTPDLVDPSQPGIVRAFHAAPQIVLQQPSPHLSQGSSEGLPPLFSDSRQESPQLQQYLPEKQPLRQQPIPTTNLRVERNLVVNGVTPVGSPSSLVKGRPRRHSINHPPSIAPNSGSGSSSGSNGGHGLHFPHLHIHGLGVSPASPLRREFSRQDSDDPYTGTGSPVRSPRIAQSPQAPLAPSPLPSPPPPRPSSTPPVPPPLNLATSALPPASSSSPSFVTENESRGSSTGGRTRNNSDTFSLASTASSSLSVSGGGGRESTATTPTSGHQHGNAFRNMLSNLKNKKKSSNSSSTHSSTSPSPTRTPTTATMSHLHEHIYEEHTSSQIPQFPTLAMDSHMLQGPQMQQELEQQQRQQQTTTTTTTAAAAAIDATTA